MKFNRVSAEKTYRPRSVSSLLMRFKAIFNVCFGGYLVVVRREGECRLSMEMDDEFER